MAQSHFLQVFLVMEFSPFSCRVELPDDRGFSRNRAGVGDDWTDCDFNCRWSGLASRVLGKVVRRYTI